MGAPSRHCPSSSLQKPVGNAGFPAALAPLSLLWVPEAERLRGHPGLGPKSHPLWAGHSTTDPKDAWAERDRG